jgi:hypothetical protein
MRRHATQKCALLLAVALLAAAQSNREDYRPAYRAWREAEPTLESDAAKAGDTLMPRTDHAASAEAKYSADRAAFLRKLSEAYSPAALSLQTPVDQTPPGLTSAARLLRFVNGETATVNANITAFAKDTDPGILPLKQALDRERTALAALNAAIVTRQKADDKLAQDTSSTERTRVSTLERHQSVLASINAAAESLQNEDAAWLAYYQKLAEGARLAAQPLPAPAPSAPAPTSAVPSEPVTVVPVPGNPVVSGPVPNVAAPVVIAPLPLARYVGTWAYSRVGGLFHGAEPESLDLIVHEDNGKVSGTLSARFKIPSGGSGDPAVRFDFSGDLRTSRIQSFPLLTDDGSKGTVELIPGNAFNLLEVNFQTEMRPGKIHLGDVLLVKQ